MGAPILTDAQDRQNALAFCPPLGALSAALRLRPKGGLKGKFGYSEEDSSLMD